MNHIEKKYHAEYVDQLSDHISAIMDKDLEAYETSHGIDVNFRRFSLVFKDETENPIDVINAFTAFAEIYVDDMWVHSKYRGQGFGRKLLQELEDHFKGKGFNNINLITNEFNAPEFYKKCGFTAEFTRINTKNPKLSKTFFVKFFDDEVQTQGINVSDNS